MLFNQQLMLHGRGNSFSVLYVGVGTLDRQVPTILPKLKIILCPANCGLYATMCYSGSERTVRSHQQSRALMLIQLQSGVAISTCSLP